MLSSFAISTFFIESSSIRFWSAVKSLFFRLVNSAFKSKMSPVSIVELLMPAIEFVESLSLSSNLSSLLRAIPLFNLYYNSL